MSVVISIALQKGGTAKTTTAINLAYSLRKAGKSVLLIDLDSQANSSFCAGINSADLDNSLYNVLTTDRRYTCQIREAILQTAFFDVLPADRDVADLANELKSPQALEQKLASISSSYDVIVLDCPPSLNIITVNAFVASDWVIIPTQPLPFNITGMKDLAQTIEEVKSNWNPGLQIMGILLVRHNNRTNLSRKLTEMIEVMSQSLSTSCFKTSIRDSIVVPESQLAQRPLLEYAPKSKPAVDYEAFSKEVLERIGE